MRERRRGGKEAGRSRRGGKTARRRVKQHADQCDGALERLRAFRRHHHLVILSEAKNLSSTERKVCSWLIHVGVGQTTRRPIHLAGSHPPLRPACRCGGRFFTSFRMTGTFDCQRGRVGVLQRDKDPEQRHGWPTGKHRRRLREQTHHHRSLQSQALRRAAPLPLGRNR